MTTPRVDEIILPTAIANDYESAEPFNSLIGVKRLNAFVGPNNSGKSRLLRELFIASRNLMISTSDKHAVNARQAVRSAIELNLHFQSQSEIYRPVQENIAAPFGFHECCQHPVSFPTQLKEFERVASLLFNWANNERQHPTKRFPNAEPLARALRTIVHSTQELESVGKPKYANGQQPPSPPPFAAANFIYIPTLRGMRLSSESNDLSHAYFDRTWTDYFKGRKKLSHNTNTETIEKARATHHGTSVLTGLDLYDWLTNRLLGGLSDRELIRSYQEFLSETFFQGDPVALIPRRDHDTINIKVGREKERPVQSLGDGLQQLIILTLPLFEHRDAPLFLFIEEPDLFLHPGYQRVLIDTILADPDRQLYVFVTTHSSQFLDITIAQDNCAIFRCAKVPFDKGSDNEQEPRFSVMNATFGDRTLLKHLGIRPSSVMFSNCTIWVEGITDRLYFSRYVELMLKERGLHYTENLHYSFVEYSGGNITHWSFLDEEEGIEVERLCAMLLLISDKDVGKDKRHDQLEAKLGNHFIRLPVRESENLLTPEVITQVICSYEGNDSNLNKFTQSAYAGGYLGRYIDNKVLVDKKKSKRYHTLGTCYEDTSGTVKSKVEFCRRALQHINQVGDLSDHAKQLATKICDFIVAENS